jgi:xylulokinase
MILGIDLGSSLFKAVLFDGEGRALGTGAAPVAYLPDLGNRVEMPVMETGEAFRRCIAEALAGAGVAAGCLTGIAIASQAQTFTVRSPDGVARFPFMSWRDSRCKGDNGAAAALADFGRHSSCAECVDCLTVAQLEHGRRHATVTVGPQDLVLFLPSWFIMQLTGCAVTDTNIAAMSGLYSLPDGTWWADALRLCGITPRNLPALTGIGAIAGRITAAADAFGLPPGIPVILAGNDQTAGAYGAAIDRERAALVTLGTAQVVYACRRELPPPSPGVIRGPYPGGLFYQLASDAYGAGTINWACTVLPGCKTPQELDRAAAAAPEDCHGVIFVPDGPAGTGRWTGTANPGATVADQARAVFVCLSDRFAAMLERMSFTADSKMMVAGGGSRSAPWMECLQKRIGIPLSRCTDADPARGAFRMALAAIPDL